MAPKPPVTDVPANHFAVLEGNLIPKDAQATTLTFKPVGDGNHVTVCLCFTFKPNILTPGPLPQDGKAYGVFPMNSPLTLTNDAPVLKATTDSNSNLAAIASVQELKMTSGDKGERGIALM